MSHRRWAVSAVMALAVLGSAALGQQTATPPVATTTPTAHQVIKSCPKGSAAVVTGKISNCEPLNQPESFADLANMASSYRSRTTAPFGTVAPGAYEAAIKQKAAIAAPGALPGSGGGWTPYGVAPECAHQSTVAGATACPAPSPANGQYANVGSLGFVTLSGRITSFAYDPSVAGRFFASPVAGGVFESLDGGATWHSIGDGLATQVVGAIAYDVPLHRLIVGTGDNSFGGDGISGHGVYTTDNDGGAWATASGFPDLALSFRVVVSPADASGNTVYVASSKGLFKSSNGANSFVNENLATTPAGYLPNCKGDTTTPLCFFANIVTDVVVKGTASTNAPAGSVMAVVGWRAGQKQDTKAGGAVNMDCTLNGNPTPCLQAPQNGLYISTTGLPGSFAFQSQGATGPATTQGFAPDPVVGRTALGIAHGAGQDNDAVYALVQDAQKFAGCFDVLDTGLNPACNGTATGETLATYLDGMYATYDFGKTWTKIMDYTQTKYQGTNSSLVGQPGYSPGIQSWYNLWVEPDPSSKDSNGDPTRVAFGLEEIWENNQLYAPLGANNPVLHQRYGLQPPAQAGADPWVVIGRYWNACSLITTPVNCNDSPLHNSPIPGTTTHPDQHAALFVPDGQGGVTLYAGSDGGVYSQKVAAGADFTNDKWGDGNNIGLYSLQPYDAEIANDGTVVAGLQDNGEEKIVNGKQAEIFGGDAFFSAIDPAHSDNIVEEYTYGAMSLTNDGGASWFSVTPSACSSSSALFATPFEQDPTTPGHLLIGCTQIQDITNAYANPCTPTPQPPASCAVNNTYSDSGAYDLAAAEPTWNTPPIPSATGVRGANEYVGFCGYCDVVTGGLPFRSGLATNVGGSSPPAIGSVAGWHIAADNCSNCGTPDGKLPQRYITSTQLDPSDPNTVYLTMGGYGRRWIPPGALGDTTAEVGTGHVFKSTDHGEHFTDITGNLPDVPANWTLIHNGQLVVATDLGVFESADTNGNTWGTVGTGLPNTPVFTLRLSQAHPDLMVVSTFGRGVYQYDFSTPVSAVPEAWLVPLLPLAAAPLFAAVLWRRRRRPVLLGSRSE
jgi:hypothetical protein